MDLDICDRCQPKVDELERAIQRSLDGHTKDVEFNRCFYHHTHALLVVANIKDYCYNNH